MTVAQATNRVPSELAGVRCTFCAYCVDESLVFLERKREADAIEQAQADAEFRRAEQVMRRG